MHRLVFVLLFAGCLAPVQGAEAWHLGGSFTTERTQADIDAVCEAGEGKSECAIMESFPEQFSFRFDTRGECEAARARIQEIPHTNVGECTRVTPTSEPDAPTSSTAQP